MGVSRPRLAAVDPALLWRVALTLAALPVTCFALCTFRVEPIHGWMMRHDCPFARLAMNPPAHPSPALEHPRSSAMSMKP
jgi:hypothetical protein